MKKKSEGQDGLGRGGRTNLIVRTIFSLELGGGQVNLIQSMTPPFLHGVAWAAAPEASADKGTPAVPVFSHFQAGWHTFAAP